MLCPIITSIYSLAATILHGLISRRSFLPVHIQLQCIDIIPSKCITKGLLNSSAISSASSRAQLEFLACLAVQARPWLAPLEESVCNTHRVQRRLKPSHARGRTVRRCRRLKLLWDGARDDGVSPGGLGRAKLPSAAVEGTMPPRARSMVIGEGLPSLPPPRAAPSRP